ncbi:phosphoadenosine phosphosulfate reductase family protein [Bengtsoniella intestinalis]|uniref:phosphoadenosine phosphosulfate reductase domain-containing protein n=1 Tax=Bengtsoniella intestinalis TaxID=3073143 RepID=UPI00391FA3B5
MAKFILGRKQSIDNGDWLEAVAQIETLVSREELDTLVATTLEEIREVTAGKHTAYAWSGGKDSIVLEKLCDMVGITSSVLGHCSLEYPAFMDWVQQHKPNGCSLVDTGQDYDFIKKNPIALFPPMTYHWSRNLQIAAQNRYYKAQGLEVMMLGRRKADGNFVGKGTNFYTDSKGMSKYNPLADWKHEHVLAFIHYYQCPVPPIYEWDDGYKIGTHPWFARPYIKSPAEGWAQIHKIDPSVVVEAAEHLPSAESFLEGVNA